MGSTADLLFRIAADSAPAEADLAAFRGKLAGEMAGVRGSVDAASAGSAASFRGAMGSMAAASSAASAKVIYDWRGDVVKVLAQEVPAAVEKTTASTTGARLAMRGLGEEVGVRMPRFVASWLTSLGPVSGIMSMAFAPIAVIGLVEVLGRIPGAIQKGIDWLHGWTEESKKAFEESRKAVLAAEAALLDYHQKLREIQLIGLDGTAKLTAEQRLNGEAIDEVVAKLVQYKSRLDQLRNVAEYKPKMITVPGYMGVPSQVEDRQGPSHAAMDKAKTEMQALQPAVDALLKKLEELQVETARLAAETTSEGAKAAQQAMEAQAAAADELQRRILGQSDQTLQVKLKSWDLEIEGMRKAYAKEGALTDGQEKLVAELRRLGRERIAKEDADADARKADEAARATTALEQKIAQQTTVGLEDKERAWEAEIRALTASYQKEGQLTAANVELIAQLRRAGLEKVRREAADAASQATAELEKRLGAEATLSLESRHAAFDREIDQLAESYRRKQQLTAANEKVLAAVRAAGHDKIDADNKAAYAQEMAALTEHLAKIRAATLTGADRIAEQYQADVERFSAAEEKKALTLATSEAQRTAIAAQYAAIRAALLGKEGTDLQTLRNSQGWQGVFGSEFASMIRGNEALTKEWASSTNQSLLMVRLTMEGLREMSQQAFREMAQGMGQNIASAIVYKKSIGEAMRAAVASTLESIAAESIGWAIYATALGFLRLAQHDPVGATAAFTSAAIWGSVGVAAAVAGRLVAPPQAGAGAAGAGAAGVGGGSVAASDPGAVAAQSGPRVQVIVQGHVFGVSGLQELAAALNDAVLNRDVTLTATNTKTSQVVTR